MKILGIWDGHDSGAAIVIDGSVAVAVNEERLSRRKLEIRFPSQSILTCLSEAGMEASDLHAVAYSTTDVAKTIARVYPESKERYYAIRRRKCLPGRMSNAQKQLKYWLTLWPGNRLTRCIGEAAIRRELRRIGFGDSRLVAIEHHAAHASAAAHCSPFPSCTVVTIDGLGDGLSSTVSRYTDGRMERVAESPAGHSLGIFFEHVTNLLNMRELEDEGKVMALSTFAYPIAAEDNPLMDFFRVRDARLIARYGPFEMYRQLRRVLWQYPAEQFAFMAQQALEHHATSLVRQAVGLTGEARVAYSGGVASNIRANARIRGCPEVEELFVFPHMGDGGLAVGAAIAADKEGGANRPAGIEQIYWGPCESAPPEALPAHVRQRSFATLEELLSEAAARLASDEILLWYQSRMEFGPRALGHRSILARPDRPEMRDRLNLQLKKRVWYQPFCPSILDSEAQRLLIDATGRPDRFMTMAYAVNPAYRGSLSAVTSVDGTCRPQFVADDADPYSQLLQRLKRSIGVGAVLNTSMNIHGEPMVGGLPDAFRLLSGHGFRFLFCPTLLRVFERLENA